MRVGVIGAGYVGLVSCTGFAEIGNDVICADIEEERVARLLRGEVPIFEPGLGVMIRRNVSQGRLHFTADVLEALREAEVIFIAVGTPSRADGSADLSAVDSVTDLIERHVEHECVLVLKSTVPVGTNDRVRRRLGARAERIHVVSNPEFLKEGDAVNDFMRPDRIVIGCDPDDGLARDRMRRLYHPLLLNRERIVWMNPASAELTKYVANTMLAMRISFMNEIASLCEQVGADVNDVRLGVGSDLRIGPKFLYAGPGYGGSCFPKDVSALLHTGRGHNLPMELTAATQSVNQRQKCLLFRKLSRLFGGELRQRRIALWGLAFKPQTDDIRDSAALALIDGLLAEGARVSAHDPEAGGAVRGRYGEAVFIGGDPYQALEGADALVLVTEWRLYQSPDFARIRAALRTPTLIDGRNIWSTYRLHEQGFHYEGVGVGCDSAARRASPCVAVPDGRGESDPPLAPYHDPLS